MLVKRIELHNHSTESDGSLTVAELARFAAERGFGSMVLTDHNTISGHGKLAAAIAAENLPLDALPGLELTTYCGHLLCLGTDRYIPWADMDPTRPEILFDRVRKAGGLAGIAHPFAMGAPVSTGCEWVMPVRDFDRLDFIEVVNNSASIPRMNELAVEWWESLVLQGHRLAATSGIDLHRVVDTTGFFTTYLLVEDEEALLPLAEQLRAAVRRQRTAVTRGPVLDACWAAAASADWEQPPEAECRLLWDESFCPMPDMRPTDWQIEVTTLKGSRLIPCTGNGEPQRISLPELAGADAGPAGVVFKLYEGEAVFTNLLAVAPPLWLD